MNTRTYACTHMHTITSMLPAIEPLALIHARSHTHSQPPLPACVDANATPPMPPCTHFEHHALGLRHQQCIALYATSICASNMSLSVPPFLRQQQRAPLPAPSQTGSALSAARLILRHHAPVLCHQQRVSFCATTHPFCATSSVYPMRPHASAATPASSSAG